MFRKSPAKKFFKRFEVPDFIELNRFNLIYRNQVWSLNKAKLEEGELQREGESWIGNINITNWLEQQFIVAWHESLMKSFR